MGIEIYPQNVRTGLEGLNQELETVRGNASPLKSSIEAFIDTKDLQSTAFESQKDYMSRGHLPAIDKQLDAVDLFIEANNRHISYIDSYLGGEGYLSEDRLIYQIECLRDFIMTAEDLQLDSIADLLRERQQSCREKLGKLQYFAAVTADLYDGVETAFAGAEAQLSALEGATYNKTTGRYFLPPGATTPNGMSKKDFIQLMGTLYGFDKQTAGIMYDLYGTLMKKYPGVSQEELDWRFVRLLGGLKYDEFQWDQTAGDPTIVTMVDKGLFVNKNMSMEEYFTEFLGMPLEDYRLLRYKVRVQYDISGLRDTDWSYNKLEVEKIKPYKENMEKALGRKLTEEEFERLWDEQYNTMKGKGDFSHQQITLASILATDLNKSGIVVDTYFLFNDEKRENMAGWLGDATLKGKGGTPSSFGADDYIADLDAANIANMMKEQNLPYLKATGLYYEQVGTDYTRAEKFLEHTSLETVKDKIFNEIADDVAQDYYELNNGYPLITLERLEKIKEEHFMVYLKKAAPDTYNFIKSLEDPKKYNEMRQ